MSEWIVPAECGNDPGCRCPESDCTGHPDTYPYCDVCNRANAALAETQQP